MNPLVYISSMFRSGTTLIARMLNVHPDIVCASDPMRPLVNSFRYDMAGEEYRKVHNRFDPLDDYYGKDVDLLEQILSADLSISPQCSSPELVETIKKRAEAFSGLYSEALDVNLAFDNYAGLVEALTHTFEECYGKNKQHNVTAFKEVWSTEFYPALKRSFPGTKCMVILRDPRSVVASKVATGEPYPYVFMGRQWRKLTCLAAYIAQEYPDDVLLFRYEDFVQAPEEYVERMCNFIGVPFTTDLLDGTKYKDGWDKPWVQNTSYSGAGSKKINAGTMDKWKTLLSPQEVASVELYTHDWMTHFNYEPVNSVEDLTNMDVADYRRFDAGDLAEWIRPYCFDGDSARMEQEIMNEKCRLVEKDDLPRASRMALHKSWW